MRLAMIPSAYRTIFFHAVAERLERAGHEVFWLSPNGRWARWLFQRGVRESRVLDVSRHGWEWTSVRPLSEEESTRLETLETEGTLCMNDIVMMDPLLVQRPRDRALKYLATCERLVREFIVSNDIRCVTAEQTWAFELLIGQVCLTLGIPHMMPHTIRIPDSRFGFFVGHRETDLLPISEPTDADRARASAFLAEFRVRKPKPSYMSVDRRVIKPELGRLGTLAKHVLDLAGDTFDETSYRPAGLIATHTKQLIRGIRNRRSPYFEMPNSANRPYVFFPLHLQPEASIDIKGSPFNAQLEIIRAMARTLPLTHDLYVKEHSVALKTRPMSFYRELVRIPGVRLISPFAESFGVITGAELVVCITGTAAYEAALLGRRTATVAPIFFDRIVGRASFDPFTERVGDLLGGHSSAGPRADDELVGFLAWITAQSLPGVVGDAFWQPDSMGNANLDRVAQGFETALEVLSHRMATAR